jgi:hypothetical protein
MAKTKIAKIFNIEVHASVWNRRIQKRSHEKEILKKYPLDIFFKHICGGHKLYEASIIDQL